MRLFSKSISYSLALLFVFSSLISCRSSEKKEEVLQFTDDLGYQMTLSKPPRKAMGIAPAMTEMLFAVCADSQIAAVTIHCNFPEKALHKTRINTYPLDIEGIMAAKPDIIFTEEGIMQPSDAEKLRSLGVAVYFQKYTTVADVFNGLNTIGTMMQQPEKTKILLDSLKKEVSLLETASQQEDYKPSILAITWHTPIYAYGLNTFMSDKIRLAGGRNAIDTVFTKIYPELSREYILKLNPDIIVGGSFGKMDSTFFMLYPELKQLKAYQNRHVFDLNDDLTSRPSPRVLESVAEIKNMIAKCK